MQKRNNNLGNTLNNQGRSKSAIECYQKALEINPHYGDTAYNMGNVYNNQGKTEDAIRCYQQAISIHPENAESFNNMANAFKDQSKLTSAIHYYKEALKLKPDYHQAHSNLLFTLQYQVNNDPQGVYEQHLDWNETHAKALKKDIQVYENDTSLERRLRIGYVSPDFRSHSCAYFLESLLTAHRESEVEIFCYSEVEKPDEMTEKIKTLSDHWFETVGISNEAFAEQIRKDQIDILIDLAGHTANNRLLVFAQKPAPIQVTWLGYPDTTGLEMMDYRFSDAVADPEGDTEHYIREKLVRLPRGFLCYTPPQSCPNVGALPF